MLDGRVHRLKRGKHYDVRLPALQAQAKRAASKHGKTAVVVKDNLGRFEYLWVQFLDGRLDEGQSCSRCGHEQLLQLQEFFALCPQCNSVHGLTGKPLVDPDPPPDPAEVIEFGELRLLSSAGDPITEVTVADDAIVEAHCRFLMPLSRVEPSFWFYRDGKAVLRADCPQKVGISEPRVLRIALRLGGRSLTPGDYTFNISVRVTVEETAHQVRRDVSKPDRPGFRVVAAPGSTEPSDDDGQPRLDWRVVAGSS